MSARSSLTHFGRQGNAPKLAYSVDETARLLSLSKTTVYQMIRRGELRSVKLGARRVIPIAEVERLLGTGQEGA